MGDAFPCRLSALGVACALGVGREAAAAGLIAGDTSRLVRRSGLVPDRELWVGAVGEPLPEIPAAMAHYACRNNALSLAALAEIAAPVAEARERFGPHRIGVVLGTSTSGVSDAEAAIRHHVETACLAPSFHYAQLEFGGAAGFLADHLALDGPAYTLSTACSSGARALASARSLLRLGVCDVVLAGATDTLCGLTTNGFAALQAVSDERTNPFSRNRQGLSLGEASALFLVTRESGGVQLLGAGESSEAHHMSAPDPTGAGAEAALRAALADAGIAPEEVAYLNLHGTGTPKNDAMEALAVDRVFGGSLPVSSSKPLVGHTLGAAGALEAAFCWLLLGQRAGDRLPLPPHRWDGERDPALPELHLVADGETAPVSGRACVATSSFGFGGNNCALVLAAEAA